MVRAAQEFFLGQAEGRQGHRLAKRGDPRLDEGGHFGVIGKLLFQALGVALLSVRCLAHAR